MFDECEASAPNGASPLHELDYDDHGGGDGRGETPVHRSERHGAKRLLEGRPADHGRVEREAHRQRAEQPRIPVSLPEALALAHAVEDVAELEQHERRERGGLRAAQRILAPPAMKSNSPPGR